MQLSSLGALLQGKPIPRKNEGWSQWGEGPPGLYLGMRKTKLMQLVHFCLEETTWKPWLWNRCEILWRSEKLAVGSSVFSLSMTFLTAWWSSQKWCILAPLSSFDQMYFNIHASKNQVISPRCLQSIRGPFILQIKAKRAPIWFPRR